MNNGQEPDDRAPGGRGRLLGRIGRQSGAYALASVVGPGTGLLLLPVYTRFLSPGEFGLIALLEVVSLILTSIFSLGMPAFVSFIFVEQATSDDRRRVLGALVIAVTVVNLLLSAVAWFALQAALPHALPSIPFWPFVPLLIVASVLEPYWIMAGAMLQIQERAGFYSLLSSVRIVTSLTLRVLLVVAVPMGVFGFTLANVMTAAAFATVGILLMRSEMLPAWDARVIRQALAVGGPTVPNNLLSYGYRLLDRVVLERIATLEQLGLYYLALRIADVMRLASDVFINAWRPIFFKEAGKAAFLERDVPEIIRLASIGMLTCFVTLSLAAPPLIRVFMAPSYAGAGRYVPLLVAAMAVKGFYAFPYIAVWFRKKTIWVPALSAITLVFSIAANYLLAAQAGVMGVATALLLSYCCLAALMLLVAQRLIMLAYPWRVLIAAASWAAVVVYAGALVRADGAGVLARAALLAAFAGGLLLLRCIAWHEVRAAFSRVYAIGRLRFATS